MFSRRMVNFKIRTMCFVKKAKAHKKQGISQEKRNKKKQCKHYPTQEYYTDNHD